MTEASRQLTTSERRGVHKAIADCASFISKEERRSADLRPASVQRHLDFCKDHQVKLLAMLEAA